MLWKEEEIRGSGEGRSDAQDISEVVDSLIQVESCLSLDGDGAFSGRPMHGSTDFAILNLYPGQRWLCDGQALLVENFTWYKDEKCHSFKKRQ